MGFFKDLWAITPKFNFTADATSGHRLEMTRDTYYGATNTRGIWFQCYSNSEELALLHGSVDEDVQALVYTDTQGTHHDITFDKLDVLINDTHTDLPTRMWLAKRRQGIDIPFPSADDSMVDGVPDEVSAVVAAALGGAV